MSIKYEGKKSKVVLCLGVARIILEEFNKHMVMNLKNGRMLSYDILRYHSLLGSMSSLEGEDNSDKKLAFDIVKIITDEVWDDITRKDSPNEYEGELVNEIDHTTDSIEKLEKSREEAIMILSKKNPNIYIPRWIK